MDIENEIREKMKKYDLVLVYPNNVVTKIAIFLTRLIFPSVKYNPLSPVFGYKGEIYGINKDADLADILVHHKYEKAYVIYKKLEYNPRRMDDIMAQFYKYGGWVLVFKYAITSGLGILVNLFLFALLYKIFGLYDIISLVLAIEISVVTTFFMHNYWVFKGRIYEKPLWRRFFGYHIALISGMLINIGTYYLFYWMGFNYLLADFIGIIFAGIWTLYIVDIYVFFAKYQKE